MSSFNPKAARAKRPCPIWVDAFQRDTQHLEADEVGVYFLLLMAMWTRETCDLPNDDGRLARIGRVSPTLWKRRIGPVVRAFLIAADGVVFSKRLREEATFVEHSVELQSRRKKKNSDDNPLENMDPDNSADMSADTPTDEPTQQPNNPTLIGGGGSARTREAEPSEREQILEAMGVGPDGVTGPSRFIGGQGDMAEAARWLALPGLTLPVVLEELRRVTATKADGPPKSFRYFTPAMQRLSGALTAPPLTPDISAGPAQQTPAARHTVTFDLSKFDDFGNRIA